MQQLLRNSEPYLRVGEGMPHTAGAAWCVVPGFGWVTYQVQVQAGHEISSKVTVALQKLGEEGNELMRAELETTLAVANAAMCLQVPNLAKSSLVEIHRNVEVLALHGHYLLPLHMFTLTERACKEMLLEGNTQGWVDALNLGLAACRDSLRPNEWDVRQPKFADCWLLAMKSLAAEPSKEANANPESQEDPRERFLNHYQSAAFNDVMLRMIGEVDLAEFSRLRVPGRILEYVQPFAHGLCHSSP